jgi:hypothetical protein
MTASKALLTALLGSVTVSSLACEHPPLAQVPQGTSLSAAEKDRVRGEVEAYVEAMKTYTACIQAELTAAGGDSAPPLTKSVLIARNNGAVTEVETVLKLLNENIDSAAGAAPAERDDRRPGARDN